MNIVILSLLHISAYAAIGGWLASKATQHRYIPKEFLLTAAFACIALLYYLIFFLSLLSPGVGRTAIWILHIIGWCLLPYGLYTLRGSWRKKTVLAYVILPLAATLILLTYYAALVSSCRLQVPGSHPNDNSTYCHINYLPGDNELPYDYAKNILNGMPHALISDWKLADRPPIQIGAGLAILTLHNNPEKPQEGYLSYQLVSILLQLSWVSAVFGLLVRFGLSLRHTVLALGVLGMNGFVYINSVFVWPKFFAASLVIMGVALLMYTKARDYNRTIVPAIVCIALGTLIHDGVIFTVFGTGVVAVFLALRYFVPHRNGELHIAWRQLGIGFLLAALLVVPWSAYKARATSSDRLVKWHLAGVIQVNDRGTVQTIIDSYKAISLHTWVNNRLANIQTLVTPIEKQHFADGRKAIGPSKPAIKLGLHHLTFWYERNDFFTPLFAIGLLNLGWLIVLWKRAISGIEWRFILASLVSISSWVLVMFLPHSTVLHQGSYATVLIIMSLLLTWLARARLLPFIYCSQFVIFLVFWVVGGFAQHNVSLRKAIPDIVLSFLVFALFWLIARYAPENAIHTPRKT